MKYWEIIADRLSQKGWSWGCVSVVNDTGRTTFVVDAHCGDGRRYVVRSDEKLTAFLELLIQADEAEKEPAIPDGNKSLEVGEASILLQIQQ